MRVLLVDDDVDMLDVSTYALRRHGFDVSAATDGPSALERWRTDRPDLVLLDVNMPRLGGVEVCRAIREQSSTPIIIMSAFNDEDRIVDAFENGADDFVAKPVSYRELAMRIRAITGRRTDAPVIEVSTVARTGDLMVDLSNCEVRKAGQPISLTRLEARALYFLASNAGRIMPSQRLIEAVWEYEGGDSFALKTHISHIRQKLGSIKGQPGYICSVPRIGYKLEAA
jgi:DNA-binding response OmpR family regulator